MNWNVAVILLLGFVSCSVLSSPRYYRRGGSYGRSARAYERPSRPYGASAGYRKVTSSYGSSKYGRDKYYSGQKTGQQSGHHHGHHNYYMSKIRYTGNKVAGPVKQEVPAVIKKIDTEVSPRVISKFEADVSPRVVSKQSRITKKPNKTRPTKPAAAARRPPTTVKPKPVVVEKKRPEEVPDVVTNVINTQEKKISNIPTRPKEVVQQAVLAPIPAVPDRPVVAGEPVIPSSGAGEFLLPNMILEPIPAVPDLPVV